ncbi:hypothetical protein JNL27_15270 [bacterium]|nr:hypothetical protein [bacterium]
MNYQSKSPPMYVWGMTLVFVCLTFIVSFKLYSDSKTFVDYNVERLDTFRTVKGKKVIGIGSSLLHNATFFDQFMSDFGEDIGYDSIRFLRIVRYGSAIEDFIPLMTPMLDASPDMIIIESNILFLLGGEVRRPKIWKDIAKFIRFAIKHPTRIPVFERAGRGNLELNMELPFHLSQHDTLTRVKRVMKMKAFKVRSSDFPKEVIDFFSGSTERKIKIIIIDVPYVILEEVIQETSLIQQKTTYLRSQLQVKYGIEYLVYPDSLGLEYYVDFSHLNQKGRERYSYWLLSCLSKL